MTRAIRIYLKISLTLNSHGKHNRSKLDHPTLYCWEENMVDNYILIYII